jgi:hypothetical protein
VSEESIPARIEIIAKKAISRDIAFLSSFANLERPYVLSLPALGALGHVELHGLALLQALEASRLDCREMHKNVFATLPADETIPLRVVEPLHCSLFRHVDTGVPFNRFTLERFGSTKGRLQPYWARAAHDRFGLTHSSSYAPCAPLATRVGRAGMDHDLVGFDVPREIRSSSSAHLSTRREACPCRRAAVERNSSGVGLVWGTRSGHTAGAKTTPRAACFIRNGLERDILNVLNLEDTPKQTASSRLRDREA